MDRRSSITLTFDNGPTVGITDKVLDILSRRDIRATFFVVGSKLLDPRCRRLAERAAAEGHWLGNHTYSHKTPLGRISDRRLEVAEIDVADSILAGIFPGKRLFRPFGGGGFLDDRLFSAAARHYLEEKGYDCVLWTSVPGDWKDPRWPEVAFSGMTLAENVVVLHDQEPGALEHLDAFIETAIEKGFEFRQGFPDTVLPMRNGISGDAMERFTNRRG